MRAIKYQQSTIRSTNKRRELEHKVNNNMLLNTMLWNPNGNGSVDRFALKATNKIGTRRIFTLYG